VTRQAGVVELGTTRYADVFAAMQEFTSNRDADTADEIWLTQHEPVFTQGQAGKAEHLLMPGDIPVVQSDRGGQVTYHGPGQLVAYLLFDLRRAQISVRELVTGIEESIVATLAQYDIHAQTRADAPGVYVQGAKIGSLGLRVRRGCSYHGLSLNVKMDLEPFARINPCGLLGMEVVQVADLGGPDQVAQVSEDLLDNLARTYQLNLNR
jgi:lipoyl(octanoyl) transferase